MTETLHAAGLPSDDGPDRVPVAIIPFVRFECPNCRANQTSRGDGVIPVVDTALAAVTMPIQNGTRWLGAPCSTCGATYTVESVRDSE